MTDEDEDHYEDRYLETVSGPPRYVPVAVLRAEARERAKVADAHDEALTLGYDLVAALGGYIAVPVGTQFEVSADIDLLMEKIRPDHPPDRYVEYGVDLSLDPPGARLSDEWGSSPFAVTAQGARQVARPATQASPGNPQCTNPEAACPVADEGARSCNCGLAAWPPLTDPRGRRWASNRRAGRCHLIKAPVTLRRRGELPEGLAAGPGPAR